MISLKEIFMSSFSQIMGTQRILPIIQSDDIATGVKAAGIMQETGLKVIEVVLRSPIALEMLREIKLQFPNMVVGAGTITSRQILEQALSVNADYIITPTISASLLRDLDACPVPVLPGVSVMSDILQAVEFGYSELKLFPASLAGGAPFLQAVNAVFPNVKFCPTGGVSQENKSTFLDLPNVFAAGGTWLAKKDMIEAGDWDAVKAACIAAQA